MRSLHRFYSRHLMLLSSRKRYAAASSAASPMSTCTSCNMTDDAIRCAFITCEHNNIYSWQITPQQSLDQQPKRQSISIPVKEQSGTAALTESTQNTIANTQQMIRMSKQNRQSSSERGTSSRTVGVVLRIRWHSYYRQRPPYRSDSDVHIPNTSSLKSYAVNISAKAKRCNSRSCAWKWTSRRAAWRR